MATREQVRSPAVWRAADVADARQWTTTFTAAQATAITAAADRAVGLGRAATTVTREDFDLPELRPDVPRWVEALNAGGGFVLLRGFPVGGLSPEATELAYVGLGLQLGQPVGQDANASVITHVRDEGIERTDPSVRLYRTRHRQDFHTDGSDIVGLLCLHKAKTSGESRISSSYAVYNEILRRRPDLTEILYEPMYWDRNNEQSEGEDPFFAMPVFSEIGGMPRVFYIGWYIRDAQRHPQAPRLTAAQREAIDIIEGIANDPEFYLGMRFEPGDIQLISNAKILHSREAYEDFPEPERRRHLLRLWLTAHDFASVDEILRAGIPQRKPSAADTTEMTSG
jgi:hypothetical protein